MQLSLKTLLTAMAAISAVSAATRPKANEYKDTQCSNLNYGHNSFELRDVTMDDTSKSVYVTHGARPDGVRRWFIAYSGKTSNGGSCNGDILGTSPEGCVNLNTAFPGRRIKCLRSIEG